MKRRIDPIIFIYVLLPVFIIGIAAFIAVSKVRAEWIMCKTYYFEMNTWDCYWSPKVLPQRGSK